MAPRPTHRAGSRSPPSARGRAQPDAPVGDPTGTGARLLPAHPPPAAAPGQDRAGAGTSGCGPGCSLTPTPAVFPRPALLVLQTGAQNLVTVLPVPPTGPPAPPHPVVVCGPCQRGQRRGETASGTAPQALPGPPGPRGVGLLRLRSEPQRGPRPHPGLVGSVGAQGSGSHVCRLLLGIGGQTLGWFADSEPLAAAPGSRVCVAITANPRRPRPRNVRFQEEPRLLAPGGGRHALGRIAPLPAALPAPARPARSQVRPSGVRASHPRPQKHQVAMAEFM